jgi:ribose 5-phosphate isomerase A
MDQNNLKWQAAAAAVAEIADGMVLGLGTGSTAAFMIELLGARIRAEGLRVRGIPTSRSTADLARKFGVPLTDFAADPVVDLAIDGADQITRAGLDLIKGFGGALLREKIVADAARRFIIMGDASKLADHLSLKVPVEVVRFGWEATSRKIADRGAEPTLRVQPGGEPFVSDEGNFILDCDFSALGAAIPDPARRDSELRALVGVIETGFFLGRAARAYIAGPGGVARLDRTVAA